MPEIPDYQTIQLPLLRLSASGATTLRSAVQALGEQFGLSLEQMIERLPSGQGILYNRTGWAKTELVKAGLVEQPRRGLFQITERGRVLLQEKPDRLGRQFLLRYPEFRAYIEASQRRPSPIDTEIADDIEAATITLDQTPSELIDFAIQNIEAELRDDILDRIFAIEVTTRRAAFFEELVVKLLVAMGYGKGVKEAGQRIGRSGDGGVDGVINLDPLGIDRVYLQAKCFDPKSSVVEREVRDFSGSLDAKKTNRGVFITTADFSGPVRAYVASIQKPIVLINGDDLTRLMILHNVGVREERQVAIKKLDEDFLRSDPRSLERPVCSRQSSLLGFY